MANMKKTVKLAKALLAALGPHAKHAVKQGVPREIYLQAILGHAADAFDRAAVKAAKKRGSINELA